MVGIARIADLMRGLVVWGFMTLAIAGAALGQEPPPGGGEGEPLYSGSYALVIGIDGYDKGWPRLTKAVEDAHAIRTVLEQHGFEVTLLLDTSADRLREALLEFFVVKGIDPDARLLLWYAGHGETIDGEGYLVPRDAPVSARPEFLLKAIPIRVIGSFVRLAQARHVLAVFDACFAGTIFEARGAGASGVSSRLMEPVRQFLTAGDAGQTVRDDGSFREYFVRAVTGEAEADINADGLVTGSELGLHMSQRITALTEGAQTPRHGKLHDHRFNRGDFLFEVATAPDRPVEHVERDALFWQSIKWSRNRAEYLAYLRHFPDGAFAELARIRIDELEPDGHLPSGGPLKIMTLDETRGVAAATTVNVRSGPSGEAPILSSLEPQSDVAVSGKVLGSPWYRVRLADGRTGYLLATYLVAVDGPDQSQPSRLLDVTFGAPINETVQIDLGMEDGQVRRTFYLRNGSIVWFHGDVGSNDLRFSIHLDTPLRSRAPTFRNVIAYDGRQSLVLANVNAGEGRTWGVIETEYDALEAAVDLFIRD